MHQSQIVEDCHVRMQREDTSGKGSKGMKLPSKLTSNTEQELPRKALDVSHREREVIIVLEEVKHRAGKQPCYDANVIFVVKAVQEMDTFARKQKDM